MVPFLAPEASIPPKESETEVAAPPLHPEANPSKGKIVETVAKEMKASASKAAKLGKHVIGRLPRIRFFIAVTPH